MDPTTPLVTSTRLNAPEPIIGPTAVVPRPTNLTFTNSSSILIKSPLDIVPIPDNANTVSPAPTDPKLSCKVYDNLVTVSYTHLTLPTIYSV